jgi:hypothetical protein
MDYLVLDLNSISIRCESRVTVAEARGQFRTPKERESSPLEAGTRGLVKREQTEKIQYDL